MTRRERTLNLLRGKKIDRLPAVHFGYWWETLQEWAEQGHISKEMANNCGDNSANDHELDNMLGWDHNWQSLYCPINTLIPKFEYKEIDHSADGFITYINPDGIIEKTRAGAVGIPAEVDYLLKDRESYEQNYKSRIQFSVSRLDNNCLKALSDDTDRDYPIGLHLGSILGEIRNFVTIVGMSYMIADDYELLAEIIDTYADMQYKCAETALASGAKFDYAHYWEDICFNNGPLLSPQMFDELCKKHYVKRNELCKKYNIDIISLDCDGVIDKLVPTWLESGVNVLFPLEVGTWGDQFVPLREKHGNGFRGIGAMDKTVFRKDKAAVDAELARITKSVQLGGYVPCPDHRIMPGSKWELVQYYTDKIKSIKI